ncbi:MAG TPA: ATP-grasp domain-containing protein [Puia sp.]|nr:ATP-grasp domain-containing protein [Puia sp.]
MENRFKKIQWVVQKNLTSREDLNGLRLACEKINVRYTEVNIIPFAHVLPEFEITPCNVYYGSTTFNQLIYGNEMTRNGLFFNPQTFSISNYIDKWGKNMLNYNASVTNFEELINGGYDSEKLFFIRPDDDSKSFSGEVKKFKEIKDWYDKLKAIENMDLSLNSRIIVSEPYNIKYEWRLWIANKKVVTASKYREYFKLKKERGCPDAVIFFAEKMCRQYTPHEIFVMDVCLCGDEYFIVECGCVNAAGFYSADINAIVFSLTDYFSKKFCN